MTPSKIIAIIFDMIIAIIIPSVWYDGIKMKNNDKRIILQIIDSANSIFSLSNAIKAIWKGNCKKNILTNRLYFFIYETPITFPYTMFKKNDGYK